MKKQENNTNTKYAFEYYPDDFQRELEAKERKLQREQELLERKRINISYQKDRADGYEYLLEDMWEEELQIQRDQIKIVEKEIEQLKELIEKQKTTASIEVFPYKRH